ncbi:prolyl oligopeptidase-like protein [Xylariales sp. PMI_506]|nr:prolyl oligopeptidase-like protein [Xylariales sp. PMI_506]
MRDHLSAAVVLGLVPWTSASLFESVVQTPNGPVQGAAAFETAPAGNLPNWKNVGVWKGIPFAASTAGANRFRSPQPRDPWNTTLVADTFGPGCPTTPGQSPTTSEDCLYLNIWSSANTTDDKLPVIIWSHPAGGSSADAQFDGGGMADKGVVFVNYNYRDGAFGWLAHPLLSEEFYEVTGSNSSGNWGLLDQFFALNWIHENIAAFGGDPDHITTVGQSAGSAAVYHMVNSPLTKGLIVGGIAESGIRDPYDPEAATLAESYNTLDYALGFGEQFFEANGVTTLDELRAIPLAQLKDTSSAPGSGAGFRAVLDYYAIPDTYENTLLKGPANDVPLVTGNTRDESGASATLVSLPVAQYYAEMEQQYGNLSTQALALYPASNATEAATEYNDHWRDTSKVSSWSFGRRWIQTATSPYYTYFWTHAPPGSNQGASHESEINYALNNLYQTRKAWNITDYEIATKMSAYWANFAKTGNPNLGGSYNGVEELVNWDAATANSTTTQELGDGWGPISITSEDKTEFLLEYFSEQVPY